MIGYTKANIDSSTLFWVFGVGYGFCDASTRDYDELAEAVDKYYESKHQIINAIKDYEQH